MNKYRIQHRVRTVLQFSDNGFKFSDFEFQQWAFSIADGPHDNAWVVSKEIDAKDVYEAINFFRTELSPILSMMCFIGQCELTYNWDSILAFRKNDNEEGVFFLRYTHEIPGVPLHFTEQEQKTLQKASKYGKPVVFEYLQDANSASNYASRLSLLIMALEGIAGETSTGKTNKDYIKNEILQDETLYRDIFSHTTGYRNKLFHGKRDTLSIDLSHKIYASIIRYFNRQHGFEIDLDVVGTPRSENGNYNILDNFYKLIDPEIKLELKAIIKYLDKRQDKDSIGDSRDKTLRHVHKGINGY